MNRLRYLMKLLEGFRLKYFFNLILVLAVGLLTLVNPYLTKVMSDDIIMNRKLDILFPVLFLFLITTIARSFIKYYYSLSYEKISQKINFDLKNEGYKKIMHLDQEYFNTHRTGDIMTLMTSDIDLIRHFFGFIFYNIIEGLTIFFGAVIIMLCTVNIGFTMFLVIMTPIISLYAVSFTKKMFPLFKTIRQMRSKLNSVVQENISANRVVKAFVREDFENQKMREANDDFRRAQHNHNRVWRKFAPYITNVQNLFLLYSMTVGGVLVMNGVFSVGELLMFNALIYQIANPLNNIGWIVNDLSNAMASLDKVKEFLETPIKIANEQNPVEKKALKGEIEFMNVTFNYGQEHALNNVSFHIYQGQKIGIIGSTGSGKSTIISLISRFYDPDAGRIYMDGIDIKKIDLNLLRDSIAIAHQDVFLFSESIAQNIAYGRASASEQEIREAAEAADADSFISEMEEGYQTIVGERGVGLSGGQKQRIALARALLKNPSILVLDDTTSSLDAQTERYIQNQLKRKMGNRTVFIISQRISSVKDCDLILVLDNGKIIERGTHEELVQLEGYYHMIFKHQFGNFNREEGVKNA